jgi:hypothetical protein
VSNGIDLSTALGAAKGIDRTFEPATSIRALQFYGDLERVPAAIQHDLTRWAQEVDFDSAARSATARCRYQGLLGSIFIMHPGS